MSKHWRIICGGLFICVFIIAGTWGLYWAIGPQTPQERNDFAKTMLQILGGLVVILGLYITWQTLGVNRATLLENEKANRERERITEEGRITSLYTQAVSQLGSEKHEVRLGGIYALERIARDSKKDYQQIIEVLAAYIRQNAQCQPNQPLKRSKAKRRGAQSQTAQPPLQSTQSTGETIGSSGDVRPKEDIQAALNALRRRRGYYTDGEAFRIDLHATDLRGADLADINLGNAQLHHANLSRADLRRANLSRANLWRANLSWADLTGANLRDADTWDADLTEANRTDMIR